MHSTLVSFLDQHHPAFLLAALAVAAGSAATALGLFKRARSDTGWHRALWLAGAAAIAGIGFWAAHFITLLAYDAGLAPRYALAPAALALVVMAAIGALILAAALAAWADRRMSRRIKNETDRFQQLAEATFEGIAISRNGIFLNANGALGAFLGIEAKELVGRALTDFVDQEQIDAARQNALSAPRAPFEMTLTRTDGRTIEVEVLIKKMADPDGDVFVTAARDLSARRRSQARIEHLSCHDPLTGLPNRTKLMKILTAALDEARTENTSVAVMIFDLRKFADMNKTYGLSVGDQVIQTLATRVSKVVGARASLARLQGDEFVLVQVGRTQPQAIGTLAEEIAEAARQPMHCAGQTVSADVWMGAAIFPWDGRTADDVINHAQTAALRAKTEGSNRLRFFELAIDTRQRERRSLEHELKHAFENGELELFYQPQADTLTGTVHGFEALMRWRNGERGPIPPATFIPIAEESGLILPIGAWALKRACTDAAAWPETLRVAVNLSPRQFANPRLEETVREAIASSGLAPGQLELEVTESSLIVDIERSRAILGRLKDMGVKFAIDDFGTGYSSLAYLREFPFDKIKIDRAFVSGIDHREDTRAIARAIIALARALGLSVLAEGVETTAELETLRRERCEEIQGFLLARPMPVDDIPAFLARQLRAMSRTPLGEADSAQAGLRLASLA